MEVALIEDNPQIAELYHMFLVHEGHSVVRHAANIEEAYELVIHLAEKKLRIGALLLDANLGTENSHREDGSFPEFKYTNPAEDSDKEIAVKYDQCPSLGRDGRTVRAILDACGIDVPVIGISSKSMSEQGIKTDYEVPKHDISGISSCLNRLQETQ